MQHDCQLRDAARVIYDECYPSDEWTALPFDEAERYGTLHYRQAVGAARRVRAVIASPYTQPPLPALL